MASVLYQSVMMKYVILTSTGKPLIILIIKMKYSQTGIQFYHLLMFQNQLKEINHLMKRMAILSKLPICHRKQEIILVIQRISKRQICCHNVIRLRNLHYCYLLLVFSNQPIVQHRQRIPYFCILMLSHIGYAKNG